MTTAIAQAPCAKCPFRKDVPIYLRRERRREIAHTLVNGGNFPCHSTVDYDVEDEEGEEAYDTSDSVMCAGAAKAMLAVGATTQHMRVAERLGLVDLDRVEERGSEVWDLTEWQEVAKGSTGDEVLEDDDEEVETCNTVGPNCIAPAGFMGYNGGISYGTEAADGNCELCGEPLCSECADDDGNCGMCSEYPEED